MDNIDFTIFQTLRDDARISITKLAEIVNLSRPSVQYRLNKMVEEGVIEKFTLLTKPQNIGYNIVFYLKIYPLNSESSRQVIEYLDKHPNIMEINAISGSADFLVKGAIVSVEALNNLVSEAQKFAKTETMIIFQEIKETTSLDPIITE